MGIISDTACQHFSTLSPSGFARQHVSKNKKLKC